jgi:hypothetical protein
LTTAAVTADSTPASSGARSSGGGSDVWRLGEMDAEATVLKLVSRSAGLVGDVRGSSASAMADSCMRCFAGVNPVYNRETGLDRIGVVLDISFSSILMSCGDCKLGSEGSTEFLRNESS